MIRFVEGDIFESNAEALVNPVNTVGVMGKGLALEFKRRFPHNFSCYYEGCQIGGVRVGRIFPTTVPTGGFSLPSPQEPKWIINFPTKQHWKDKSEIIWIEEGLKELRKFLIYKKSKSVAIPALGAGLGGLKWEQVKVVIENNLDNMPDVDIMVYPPNEE